MRHANHGSVVLQERMRERTKIARQVIQDHPGLPKRTLARILTKRDPINYPTLESARNCIMYFCGTHGKQCRAHAGKAGTLLPYKTEIPERPEFTKAETSWAPWVLPKDRKRGLVIADLHIPYHEKKVIEIAYQTALEEGYADFIIFNGDIWDSYWFSKFTKRADQRNPKQEMETLDQFLLATRERFPKALIVWKAGNHEARLDAWVHEKVADVVEYCDAVGIPHDDNPLFLPGLFKLRERGIIWVGDKRPVKVGHLWILHGDEWAGNAILVNPARTAFLKTKACTLVAHSHIPSAHTEKLIDDSILGMWSLGCGCCLHPRYRPINNWSWSFALLEQYGDDQFRVLHKRVGPKGEVWTC